MLEQILGLIGALFVLVAYTIMVLKPQHNYYAYIISLCGGGLLFCLAVLYHNIGLMVLELAWVGINAWGLIRKR